MDGLNVTNNAITQETASAFSAAQNARIHRMAERVFISKGASFGGQWDNTANMTGLSDGMKAFHPWGPRDATLWVDSNVGAMAIVGHAESANAVNYPGSPSYQPVSIGVSGFSLLNSAGGIGWGLYGDVVKLPGSGFGVAVETTVANLDTETAVDPYNYRTVSHGGINQWVASGAGLDVVQSDLVAEGYSCWNVNHTAAGTVYLTSYDPAGAIAWAPATPYSIGDFRFDEMTDVVYRCAVSHTSGGAGFPSDRAFNPTYWKALPGFRSGIVFTAGSLAEKAVGTNVLSALALTERMQIEWLRKNGSGNTEPSAFIWADNIPDGSAAVGITFSQNLVGVTASNGVRASALRVGGASNYLNVARGTGTNDAVAITQPGAGGINFVANGVQTMQINQYAVDLAASKVFAIGGVPVVGPRKTGWSIASGTANRTTFDTASVTLPQLAQRVKALIDDLHGIAGHGLIGI